MLVVSTLLTLILTTQVVVEETVEEGLSEDAKSHALSDAIRFCSYGLGVRENEKFTMPDGSKMFMANPPALPASLKKRGVSFGPTNADVPEFVIRFASTQPMAGFSPAAPKRFNYASFNSDDDIVWTVSYPAVNGCDILVTGEEDYIDDRDTAIQSMVRQGWVLDSEEELLDGLMWKKVLSHPSQHNEELLLQAVFQGFTSASADEEGVQMEGQFRLIRN